MSAVPGIGSPLAGGLPPIDEARLPAAIRHGDATAKSAYQSALGFEQMLLSQLSQEMMKSVDPSANGSGDGSADSSDPSSGTTGLMSASDPAASMYSSLLPTALTNGIMSAGGTGLALQLAKDIDPSIGAAKR